MNNVILLGRLVEDPEVRYTQSGTAVVNFTMAVDRPGKDKGTDFIPIVAWNKLAEIIGNNLSKGRRTLIEGNLRVSSYEKDGQKRRKTEVVAEKMFFVDSKSGTGKSESKTDYESMGSDAAEEDIPF